MATSTATAHWEGDLLTGNGFASAASGALDSVPMTWKARNGGEPGSTPEELLGAAHAACFSMAFAGGLAKAGHEPRSLDVRATVSFGPEGDAFAVHGVELSVEGDVPGIDEGEFERLAETAKDGCPISKALSDSVEVQLQTRLTSVA